MQQIPAMLAELDTVIKTVRLTLCPIGRDDAQSLFEVLADPALYVYTGDTPPESVDALRKVYTSRETRRSPDGNDLWLNWVIKERSSHGTPVGYMQASVSKTHTDVAWVIGSSWQNRGYASEAAKAIVEWLRALDVTCLRAKIDPRHVASQRVATNAGLKRSGEFTDGEEVWALESDKGGHCPS